MTHFEQPSWKRPLPRTPAVRDAASAPSSPVSGLLLGTGPAGPGDSRRIAAGLAALGLVSVLLLNLGILQGAREHLVEQRWGDLADHLDTKREEVRAVLGQFEREATFVAQQEPIRRAALRAASERLSAEDRATLSGELERASSAFRLNGIHVLDADGRLLASSEGAASVDAGQERELAIRAALTHKVTFGMASGGASVGPLISLAFPMTGAGDRAPVMLFHNSIEDVLLPVLMTWPGFGPTAGAYLVQRTGNELVVVTSPPANLGLEAGQPLRAGSRHARPAEVAIEGVEARLESVDRGGRPLWTVTRYLPEYGWGLVAQVGRDEMLRALRSTFLGLLALDAAMAALSVAAFWVWRRQYRRGLARQEAVVTQRHAQRVQSIFDTAFDGILTFDRDGRVLGVNRAAERLFGRGAVDLEQQPLQSILRHLGSGTANFVLPAPGTMTRCEALRKDGQVLPVELSLGTSGEGEELLYTAIVRDISDRVVAEERIAAFADGLEVSNRRLEEANAQLEQASRLKSEFLANTSHELRTPLNGMIGFLQLVLDGLCDTKEEEEEFLKQALQCSRHLLGLINDVLDIAKIEAGKLTVEIEAVDVRTLFDEVYAVTHVQAAQKGVQITFEPPDPCPWFVRADFNKVKQVLINLVGNSLKFTPKGRITVRATARPDLGHFMFEVADTGIGIEPERQKLIFEKFIQGDGSTTRKYGGTGLGLAISRSLVELMGGIIGVHSEGEGHGTRMYFSLPVWRQDSNDEAPAEEAISDRIEGPANGALVLVVEDDSTFRRYLISLLHGHGFRTVQARHAEGGWVLARRMQPAVVVLDYAMGCPEGASLRTGWDLAERMTSDSTTRHIPVVFVTGFDEELKEKLKTTAFARHPEHLVKPIDGSVLLRKVEELAGPVEGRPIRVLMADDDPSVAAFVRKVLPDRRYHVDVASNGEECLHIMRTQPNGFDVLLLDLMMPRVSGYDVLREMTLTGSGADLPVLVLTNYPEGRNDEEKRLLEQGLVLDVLAKSSVHDDPTLLPHVIDWHLQVVAEGDADGDGETAPPEAEAA